MRQDRSGGILIISIKALTVISCTVSAFLFAGMDLQGVSPAACNEGSRCEKAVPLQILFSCSLHDRAFALNTPAIQ